MIYALDRGMESAPKELHQIRKAYKHIQVRVTNRNLFGNKCLYVKK